MGENMENEPPLLLISPFFSQDESYQQLSYNLLENDLRVLDTPNIMRDQVILASSHNWLVLANFATDDCCLWNPTSKETIELPRLKYAHIYGMCVLSKPPTEPDCHVMLTSTIDQSFCQIGDEEFVTYGPQEFEDGTMHVLKAVGFYRDNIYGLTCPRNGNLFVTIHFVGKSIEYRPIMMLDEPWSIPELLPKFSRPFGVTWLIESPQSSELLLVRKTYSCRYLDDGLDYKVFRIDIKEMKCIELDNIGQRAIFVSHHGTGFCCSSSEKIKANSIYYTDQYGGDVYVFDLEERSTTSLLSSRVAHRESVSSWYRFFS